MSKGRDIVIGPPVPVASEALCLGLIAKAPMIRTSLLLALLAVVLVVGLPRRAGAQSPPNDAARIHYDQGKTLATKGEYAAAYFEFDAGYRLDPRPAFLFNMGEAARGMGDVVKARAAFEHYLAREPAGPLSDMARKRLADLDPPPDITKPHPATASVVLPAPHAVMPTVAARRTSEMFVEDRSRTDSRPLWKKWPFWAAVGAVVVGVVVVGTVSMRGDDVTCGAGCLDLRR